jgi:pilus assembly protein CpaB
LTLAVDQSGSLAGMLRPGDHVDILGTFARAQQDYATVTILQNVLVLATGEVRGAGDSEESFNNGPRTFNNITVSVDPEEAELLVFATQRGPVNISLRSQDDVSTFDDVPEKNFGDIFEQKRRADFAHRHAQKKIGELKAQ